MSFGTQSSSGEKTAYQVYFSRLRFPLTSMDRRCSPVTCRPRAPRLISFMLFLATILCGIPAQAAGRFIVRVSNGSVIQLVSLLTGFNVVGAMDGTVRSAVS